jgi:hypothetical protein
VSSGLSRTARCVPTAGTRSKERLPVRAPALPKRHPTPHSCPHIRLCRLTEGHRFLNPVCAGASPVRDSAVISGETPIESANHASIRSLGANERRVRFPPLRPTLQGSLGLTKRIRSQEPRARGATRQRSKDGTRQCERRWLRFKSSQWYFAGIRP